MNMKKLRNIMFLGEYETAINKSGKFVETVLQILKYIISEKVINNTKLLRIKDVSEELLQTPVDTYPVSIRKIIPRSINAIYTIRSERGTAHKSGDIKPNIIDCNFVVSTCDWILAEFLRLYHNSDIKEVENIMNSLVENKSLDKKEISIIDFLKSKEINNHSNRIMAMAYYLYKFKDVDPFNIKDITEMYSIARINKPKNLNDFISKLFKRNFY